MEGYKPILPVSSLEDVKDKQLSSLSFFLEKALPNEAEKIRTVTNSFILNIHKEMLDAVLEDTESTILDKASLNIIETFHQLKAEKQIRWFFDADVRRIIYQYLCALTKLLERTEQVKKNIPDSQRSSIVRGTDVKIIDNNAIVNIPIEKITDEGKEHAGVIKILSLQKQEVENLKFDVLSKRPNEWLSKKQKEELEFFSEQEKVSKEKSPPSLGMAKMVGILRANPILLEHFKSIFENTVLKRERYTKRKIRETLALVSRIVNDYKSGERIFDLCTGTGHIATIMNNLGYPISGIDINKDYIKYGEVFQKVLDKKRKYKSEKYLEVGNILNPDLDLDNTEIWVAKHPCARGMALPDNIIELFSRQEKPRSLYLLTCCADKSVHHCPDSYIKEGLITQKEWDDLCSTSTDIGLEQDQTKIKNLQDAIRKINEVRIRYIREVLKLEAEIIEVPRTVMNQMIVVKKKNFPRIV